MATLPDQHAMQVVMIVLALVHLAAMPLQPMPCSAGGMPLAPVAHANGNDKSNR